MTGLRLQFLLYLAFLALLPARAERFVRTFGSGAEKVTVSFSSRAVDPATETEAIISFENKDVTSLAFPNEIGERFGGFALRGSYKDEDSGDIHLSLLPEPGAERYVVRPIAINVHYPTGSNTWFATDLLVLETVPSAVKPADTVSHSLKFKRIGPSWELVGRIAVIVLDVAAAIFILWRLVRLIRLKQKIRRMSPKERALYELNGLLSKKLVENGRIKDFHVELTHVVRRYIERRYAIRAPKQTTEEFLISAKINPAFPKETVGRLADFLEAADLVKFSGIKANAEMAGEAVGKARGYLESEPTEENTKEGAK